MSRRSEYLAAENSVRKSKTYADWVIRNRAPACFLCDCTSDLEVHHVTKLYHIIDGAWKLFGDWETVVEHVVNLHAIDMADNTTLCSECHDKLHKRRFASKPVTEQQIALWAALPRRLGCEFIQGTKSPSQPGKIGLRGFQTLIGIGWVIMNDGMHDHVIKFNRRKFARLLEKSPGTSFNKSLTSALYDLVQCNLVEDFIRLGNEYEVTVTESYHQRLQENPWFLPLEHAATSRMLVLTLCWFLSLQSNSRSYRIGRTKLAGHLGLQTKSPAWQDKAITAAIAEISWLKLRIDDGIYHFTIKKRGAVPIHSLRAILRDSL
jgi:hypothetical protein